MTNDDSRDTKTPDRQDESPATELHESSIDERLEAIDRITRSLLRDIRRPEKTPLESASPATRTEAREFVLEIRAQASQFAIRVLGPEAAIPYRPADDPARAGDAGGSPPGYTSSIVTTYSGPEPEALEYEEHRTGDGEPDDRASESDADAIDENDADAISEDDTDAIDENDADTNGEDETEGGDDDE